MTTVAGVLADHRDAVRATLRATFGVGLADVGGPITWGEFLALVRVAANDPRTYLGAALAGWAYPASMAEIVTIAANTGKDGADVLPEGMARAQAAREARRVTDSERAEALELLRRVSPFAAEL